MNSIPQWCLTFMTRRHSFFPAHSRRILPRFNIDLTRPHTNRDRGQLRKAECALTVKAQVERTVDQCCEWKKCHSLEYPRNVSPLRLYDNLREHCITAHAPPYGGNLPKCLWQSRPTLEFPHPRQILGKGGTLPIYVYNNFRFLVF